MILIILSDCRGLGKEKWTACVLKRHLYLVSCLTRGQLPASWTPLLLGRPLQMSPGKAHRERAEGRNWSGQQVAAMAVALLMLVTLTSCLFFCPRVALQWGADNHLSAVPELYPWWVNGSSGELHLGRYILKRRDKGLISLFVVFISLTEAFLFLRV